MAEPVIRAIHGRLLAEHGGAPGVRDPGLLSSALASPRQLWADSDERPAIERLATAYAAALVQNHPFVDGNKRVALVATLLFLDLNGRMLRASQGEKYALMMRLAANELTEDTLTVWLVERCEPFERARQTYHPVGL